MFKVGDIVIAQSSGAASQCFRDGRRCEVSSRSGNWYTIKPLDNLPVGGGGCWSQGALRLDIPRDIKDLLKILRRR